MNALPLINLCNRCEHALVSGVACDAHPSDCPRNQSLSQRKKKPAATHRRLRLITSQMALPSEYDAIRGED